MGPTDASAGSFKDVTTTVVSSHSQALFPGSRIVSSTAESRHSETVHLADSITVGSSFQQPAKKTFPSYKVINYVNGVLKLLLLFGF